MARKKSRPKKAAKSGWSISNNEYIGIVALVALLLIAAIVLKGPGLFVDESEQVAGQAIYGDVASSGIDHPAPEYVPSAVISSMAKKSSTT